FAPLIALAQARTVALVETGELAREDGEFLLRALFDLETDGSALFGTSRPADRAFYEEIAGYVAARVGPAALETVLAPAGAEAIAALGAGEGRRVAELLGLPGAAPSSRKLDLAVLELVSHERK
ncbi:MAG: hypothetical protein QOF12_2399, partial [Solirubrobacteraceae bacterium]|nr:hypothetical protein [Solirubrobacteraceae bacterium]